MTDHPPGFIIAVVDDDTRLLKSLGDLLESAEYSVRLFASATALLDSGCLAQIDCLISDIGMPVMDGLELLRVAHAARPALPVIVITGHADLLDRSPLVDSGGYRLFRKPFDGEELLSAVSEALSSPHAPAE
jgi:FixJ family two-component response regulator